MYIYIYIVKECPPCHFICHHIRTTTRQQKTIYNISSKTSNIMTVVPFLTYKILPSRTIIRENIRVDHVKEDFDTLIHVLTPILFITKTGVPKPPSLDPGVIHHLTDKPGTLNLLHLFGWFPNARGDYIFVDANSPEEINQRDEIANEFRQFYNEIKQTKDKDLSSVTNSHTIITTVPFSAYSIIPAENIVRDNVRLGHIKEDLDSMIHALTPVLYLTKTGVPKPPFLDPSIIQQLTDKPGTLNLLPLFGCTTNNRGDYVFVDANTPEEIALREIASREIRQLYDELKRVKNGPDIVVEYFLNHPNSDASLNDIKRLACLKADDDTYIVKPGCRASMQYLYQLLEQKHEEILKVNRVKFKQNKQSKSPNISENNHDSVQDSSKDDSILSSHQ
ncbi:unnamed protein product [Rotaria magnacalcarata]|uniref:Uncharacterized protein n=1 Tax=Rotaria magnacalcarata TaxID=392030 RepID=A0A816SBG1_9BILA|nr:unnamed protein product [Rotaria magnacalcarata]